MTPLTRVKERIQFFCVLGRNHDATATASSSSYYMNPNPCTSPTKQPCGLMELLRLFTHGVFGGAAAVTTTITTSVLRHDSDVGGGGGGSDDEGPFFDIEFALPLQESKQRWSTSNTEQRHYEEMEKFGSTVSPDGTRAGSLRRDPILSFSPSSGLFFKSSSKSQVPAFFLKSAAKFRVFKLAFHRRSRSTTSETTILGASPATTCASSPKQNKFFVKFKVEEVPLASLFSRDSSWRSSSSNSCRSTRHYADDISPTSEARKLTRDVLQRYLSKIKPLYIRISKRYGEKLRFSGPLNSGGTRKVRPAGDSGEAGGGADQLKDPVSQDGNIPAGLRVVCRRLRKSRSASATVTSVRSPPVAAGRRDDSLLEQQDGIQSAIAHCKRSFSRGTDSPLLRSRSDPGDGRSMDLSSSSTNNNSSQI
ncbi:hypothetical protein Cni_G25872 [Canna indica]|uniref:Membrane-associated kinase regulator 2 n=1 Tax=Canna indica TaxID=4628 RepID=A0AAQ3QPS2_9LILI|nr:hypothetical protein Cni_G25872 [Canna indica]